MAPKTDLYKSDQRKNNLLTAIVANQAGEIFELEGYGAVGMARESLVPLLMDKTINLPYGTELMFLPDRKPILYNMAKERTECLEKNPYDSGMSIFPVAAFNSPGYVITYTSAYTEDKGAGYLPLFSYGAVGWHRGKFRSAAILVDREKRQDLRLMKKENIIAGVQMMRKKMPRNRLRAHLEKCALEYECPAAKNFFLGRYEAPLPTSRKCNARCLGCLSLQEGDEIPTSQKRIDFTPLPQEIAEVALAHIEKVNRSVVSFGQGCEGDPLLEAEAVEPAIRMIRSATRRGTINMNTNASRPSVLEKLFDAGLDSMRVSMNSVRKKYYDRYFRPQGYTFDDVGRSIDLAIRKGKFVSLNYLNCPGFTDTPEELNALISYLKKHSLNMIQWRNLNYDPIRYWKVMDGTAKQNTPVGMQTVLGRIRRTFPKLKFGYFNPPKEKFGI
jgi:pyruvate-formate lyase-activating enzyme